MDQSELEPLEILLSDFKIGFQMINEIGASIFPIISWTESIQENISPSRPGRIKCKVCGVCTDDDAASFPAVLEDKIV